MKKIYYIACAKYRTFKIPKKSCISKKTLAFLLFVVSATTKRKRYLKNNNQLRY